MSFSSSPNLDNPQDDMQDERHTLHYVLVLDRSGSMRERMDEVRSAVNAQIDALAADSTRDGNECLLSIVRFDTEVEVVMLEEPIRDVKHLSERDVKPRGMTALIDATVLTINQAARLVGPCIDGIRDSLAIVVYTDGGENASRFNTSRDLELALEHHQHLKGWDISFIGASPDAFSLMRRAKFDRRKMASIDPEDSGRIMRDMTGMLRTKMSTRKEMKIKDLEQRQKR